jgi:hypothetical protein
MSDDQERWWRSHAPVNPVGAATMPLDRRRWWEDHAPPEDEMCAAEGAGGLTADQAAWWSEHAPQVSACPSWRTGLQHWWPMTETSGNRIDAVTGAAFVPTGTVGTQTGPGGGLAAGFVFADSSHLLLTPCPATLDLTSTTVPWTIQVWLKLDNNTANKRFLWKDEGGNPHEFLLGDDGSGTQAFFVQGTGTGLIFLGTRPLGSWTHYLFSRSGATRRARVNNGTVLTSTTMVQPTVTNKFFISRCYDGSGGGPYYSTFAVSRLAKWNRLLTAQEESDLFNGGSPPQYP